MWGLFFLTTAIVAISLSAGFSCVARIGMSRCLAFSLAPLLGVAAYELVGLAYEKLGIWSSWVTQAGLLFIVAAIIFSVLRFALKWKPTVSFSISDHGAILGGRLSFDSACHFLATLRFACVFAGGLFVWYLGLLIIMRSNSIISAISGNHSDFGQLGGLVAVRLVVIFVS